METAKQRAIENLGASSAPSIHIAGLPASPRWMPSRFNARSLAPDGTLVVYNSYTGAFSGFPSASRADVESRLHQKGFRGPLEGLTKYLHDRGFIVPSGTNELQRVRLLHGAGQHRTDRFELILMPSEECNFRCVYCYETFPRGTMEPWVRRAVLMMTERRLSMLQSLGVEYFGGEPLLGYEAIEEVAPAFQAMAAKHDVRLTSGMTTNGYLLTPDIALKLLRWNIRTFQVTLDGRPEDHDSHRPLKGGGKTFTTIFNNLKALRTLNEPFSVNLRVNFDRTTTPHMPEFLDAIEEFKGDPRYCLRFHAIGKWGGPNDEELDVCGVTGESERQRLDTLAAERGYATESRMPYMQARSGKSICYAARPYNLLIGADGKIMKCTIALDTADHNIVGRLSQDGRAEIDIDKLAKWVAPYFEDDETCKKCFYVPVCQGVSCPLPRVETGERPCPPAKLQIRKTLITIWDIKNKKARVYDTRTETLKDRKAPLAQP